MKYYFFVLLFFLTAYILPLGLRPMSTDEYRNAAISMQMVESGDYRTVFALDNRYLEQPSLGYYLTAGSFKLFGVNAFSLRLPAAISAGLAAFLLMFFISQTTKDNRLSTLSGVFYLSSGLVYGAGVCGSPNSSFGMAIIGSLIGLFLASEEKKFGGRKLLLEIFAGVMLGAAFWLKGSIAVAIVGITMTGFLVWEKRFKDIFSLPWIPLFVACLTVAPWVYLIHQAEPDFWRYFLADKEFWRCVCDTPENSQPFWYLWPVLLAGIIPVIIFLPASIIGWWRNRSEFFESKLNRFALCGLFLPMIFFSFFRNKEAAWILPGYFSLAIITALGLAKYLRSGGKQTTFTIILRIFGGILLATGITVIILCFPRYGHCQLEMGWFMGLLLALWGALATFAPANRWKWQLSGFFTGLALSIVGFSLFFPMDMMVQNPEAGLKMGAVAFKIDQYPIITTDKMIYTVSYIYARNDLYLSSGGKYLSGKDNTTTSVAEIKDKHNTDLVFFITRTIDSDEIKPKNFKYRERHVYNEVIFYIL